MGDLPHRVQPDPDGRYTVDVHVTPDGHARIGNRTYTPEEFADILRRNGDYDGRPIRLIGCDAGSNDFAKRLSRELDTEVMAPSKPAWTDSNGRVFSSDYEVGPDGKMRPKIPPNGDWDVHSPDGTARRASDDGFTPDTSHADKQDLDPDDARARGDEDDDFDTSDWDEHEIDHDDPRFDHRFVDYDRPGHDLPRDHPDNPYHRPPDSPQEIESDPRARDYTKPGEHLFEKPETPGADPKPKVPSTVPKVLESHTLPPDHTQLAPNTEYHVTNKAKDGSIASETRFFTDENGRVKWAELSPGTGPGADGKRLPANPDFDYPLLPDTKYRVDNYNDPAKKWDFETDSRGQTESMTGQPEYQKSNPEYRDDSGKYSGQIRAGHEGKVAYQGHPDYGDVKWAGGHFAANESGGPPGYGNMHPQMAASNSGTYQDGWDRPDTWRAQEEQFSAYHSPPDRVVEQLQAHGTRRNADGIPEEVTMRWRITEPGPDGNPVSRVFERVFVNVPENM